MPAIPEMNTSRPGPAFERVYPAKSRYCECVVGCAICEGLFEVIGDKVIIPWIRSGCRHLFVWQANVTAPWQHCNRQQERRSHSVPRRTRPLALKTGPALPAQQNPPHPAQKRIRIFSKFLEHPYGELNAFHLNGPFSGASVNNSRLTELVIIAARREYRCQHVRHGELARDSDYCSYNSFGLPRHVSNWRLSRGD